MVAGYACGLDFSPEMSYLCRSLKQTSSDEMWKLFCPSQISIFSSVAMVTARRTFGIGRPQSCCRSGRRMTMSAFRQSPLPLCTHYSLWTARHSYSPARHILQIFKLIPTCRCCGTPTRPARWPLLGGMAWSSSGIEIFQTYLMAKVCAIKGGI